MLLPGGGENPGDPPGLLSKHPGGAAGWGWEFQLPTRALLIPPRLGGVGALLLVSTWVLLTP